MTRPNEFTEQEVFTKSAATRSGCWQWTGRLDIDGYGGISVRGAKLLAHRFSWIVFRGEIPAGLTLDHLCRNRACVNPDHLEPVDLRTNILRGTSLSAQRARQTKCQRGHALDGGTPRRRKCKTCQSVNDHKRYVRRIGEAK